jgi:multidrug resistance efflux pump
MRLALTQRPRARFVGQRATNGSGRAPEAVQWSVTSATADRVAGLSAIARFGASSLIRYYLRRSVIYFFRGCPANVRAAAQEILESAEPVASARLHPNPASPHMRSPNSRRAQGLRSAMAPSIAVPEPVSAECDIADAVDPCVNRTKEEPPPVGARSVQSLLERSLPAAAAEAERVDARPAGRKSNTYAAAARRFFKIGVGIALVVAFGWAPLRAMLATTSVEAIINARIETIRSPLDGVVQFAGQENANWSSAAVPPKLVVFNPYADRSRLDELRREQNALESQTQTLERQSHLTQTALDALDLQVEKFRKGRLKLIEARLAAQAAELEAATAKTSQVAASKHRSEQLQRTGDISAVESDRAQYEWSAATSAEAAARKRLEETTVERDAVADGVFVGDSYNDSPSSQQRAAELRLRKGELAAQAEAARSQTKHIADQIAEEEARYRQRSEATVVLPAKGRVWEMLIGPGEYVSKGQDLLRVLDCSNPIVSANVDERVYDRLEVGSPATFRPFQGGKTYRGTVTNLTGAAGASANFAIPPLALRKSPFYVTIAIDDMGEAGCSIGRTGTVTFGSSDVSSARAESRESRPYLKGSISES